MNNDRRFQVWFVPTEKGRKAFGWQEQRLGKGDLMTADEASFEAYVANLEEPAPDAREYGSYEIREIPATILWQCRCGWVIDEVSYLSIVFDAWCPRCRAKYSTFQRKQ